jgi:hypothetical protein
MSPRRALRRIHVFQRRIHVEEDTCVSYCNEPSKSTANIFTNLQEAKKRSLLL